MRSLKKLILALSLVAQSSLLSINPLKANEALVVGAIPDQNPEKLNRRNNLLITYLAEELNIPVKYLPVTNYAAAVTAFRTGGLDLVWFGGLTGVQARLQKPGAKIIAQRDVDAKFHSVFIANKKAQIPEIKKISDLHLLKGRRFTFGSENSTSGRLMPQYFLLKSGVKTVDFKGGRAGFSGSHDATLALVQSGSYEVGAMNKQVWETRVTEGKVNLSKVKMIWKSPPYFDYHWLAQPGLDERFGKGFTKRLIKSFLKLNKEDDKEKKILSLFGANKFIPAYEYQYKKIEQIGRLIGKIK